MKYWWVNHKQTQRQEINGGYLWSPKKEANGSKSHFYDNMRRAEPGDLVLSYANGKIDYFGVVSDNAISAPKPEEFGSTGEYWSNEGWELPLVWERLKESFIPKRRFPEIKLFFPEKYSPLNEQGNGNQKAYLSEIPKELADFVLTAGGADLASTPPLPEPRFEAIESNLEDVVEHFVRSDISLSETERNQICSARRGQGEFRKNVISIESSCRVTSVRRLEFLVASHIKPWRSCSSGHERLDGCNGLLLTPTIDRLFDRGFISFSDSGELIISSRLDKTDVNLFSLDRRSEPRSFRREQKSYLEYHRAMVFLS
jgi:hypothetical protein